MSNRAGSLPKRNRGISPLPKASCLKPEAVPFRPAGGESIAIGREDNHVAIPAWHARCMEDAATLIDATKEAMRAVTTWKLTEGSMVERSMPVGACYVSLADYKALESRCDELERRMMKNLRRLTVLESCLRQAYGLLVSGMGIRAKELIKHVIDSRKIKTDG